MAEKFFALPTFLGPRHNGMGIKKRGSNSREEKAANKGKILAIFFAPAAKAPMQSVSHAALVAGHGIAEDRYCKGEGTYSRVGDAVMPKIRHITFFSAEALAEANRELAALNFQIAPNELRRNVLVEGMDLNALVKKRFGNSKVQFEGFELATPCNLPVALLERLKERKDRARLAEAFKRAFALRGGIRASVEDDELLSVGDELWAF